MRVSWLGAAAALLIVASACGSSSNQTATQPKAGKVLKDQKIVGDKLTLSSSQMSTIKSFSKGKLVGIVALTMQTQYHQNLNNAAMAEAQALGFNAEICDSQVDNAKAVACLEGFITKGAVAIITTSGKDTVGPAVQDAISKGIVVVQVTGTDMVDYGAITASVDNITIGMAEGDAAGKYAKQKFPGQKVQTMILDYPSIPDLVARADAIQNAMVAADSDVQVVGRFIGGLASNGVTSTETALQKFPNLQGIVGINDGGDLGGYQAMVAAKKTSDQYFVFGIDCDPQAVTYIDQGTIYKGCVDTNPSGTGKLAVDAFGFIFSGANVAGKIEVPVSVHEKS
ncbi:MAG TPA: sugar ABC transporter substrate-binding protein [Candidatus Dormibacteraeota bacterium]|jgi:ABC-type sugar transport system substrate-binding protein|nr:sugar ABC transporter substrate-binding protein [Candidatus Dormibacteraeota bacterium]